MRKNFSILAVSAAILASIVGLYGCQEGGAPGSSSDDVAATVNGISIPVSKIDQIIDQQIKASGPNSPQLTPVALAAARLQVVEQLIQEEAMYQRAQKEGVSPTEDEVKQALQTQIQKSGMSQDDYQKRLKDLGQTEDQLKTDMKRQLAIQKLQDKVTSSIPAPTDAEVKKYFDENKAQMTAPKGLELSDIIVDPANNGARDDAVGDAAAAQKAQEISGALKSGTDFATVARSRSEDQTALQGGSIGFFSEAQLKQTFPPDILAQLGALQVGQITGTIQSQDGRWHIFKLNGKRDQNQELTFDEVKQQIAQTITDQRKQVVLSALVIDAVGSATIKNIIASQIIEHPDTFGALRPSPLTQPTAGAPAQPAPAQTAPAQPAAQPEAQPSAPAKNEAAKPAPAAANGNKK
ncbi:MAG TPA: SurA N-terminal domain-containing protein [Blastocatellia bacterium]|nr:SurA N-terminal domain-containing protein [Blastocatellia bacterium]